MTPIKNEKPQPKEAKSRPIPTFTEVKVPTDVERIYSFNRGITKIVKESVKNIHTEDLEAMLNNFTDLVSGDYKDVETVEFPVEIVRDTALFASVTISRLLWERYKLEKQLGRSVVDREPEEKNLTKPVSTPTIE